MKGSFIGRSSKGIFRESASAAAELSPVTEVGQPLSRIGFTSEGGSPDDNVCDMRLVRRALLLSSEKTQRTIPRPHASRPRLMKQALLLCRHVPFWSSSTQDLRPSGLFSCRRCKLTLPCDVQSRHENQHVSASPFYCYVELMAFLCWI